MRKIHFSTVIFRWLEKRDISSYKHVERVWTFGFRIFDRSILPEITLFTSKHELPNEREREGGRGGGRDGSRDILKKISSVKNKCFFFNFNFEVRYFCCSIFIFMFEHSWIYDDVRNSPADKKFYREFHKGAVARSHYII